MVIPQNRIWLILSCLALQALLALSALTVSTVASAQAASQNAPPNGFVCMSRAGQGPDGSQHTARVMVPRSEEQKLSGRGFVPSNCRKAVKWMKDTGPSMCALADIQDAAFISEFLNTNGLTPQEICDLAARLPASS